MQYTTSIVMMICIVLTSFFLIVVVSYLEKRTKPENNMDWIYIDISPKILPEDQQEVEWIDVYGTSHEGVFEKMGSEFYASPKERNTIEQVTMWRALGI